MALNSIAGRTDGIVNVAYGAGTAAGADIVITLGFIPTSFVVYNETDAITYEKFAGMTAANCVKTLANGTRSTETGSLILFNSDGTVTVLAAIAVNAKVLAWRAAR